MIENENPIQECLLSESVSQVIRHVHCYHMVLKDHLGRPYKWYYDIYDIYDILTSLTYFRQFQEKQVTNIPWTYLGS